jgi:dipeptidyl-peptidase-4
VYGGPHVQRVQNNWALAADLRAQCLAQQGFVVIKCDNRGSFRRYVLFMVQVFVSGCVFDCV